MTGHLFSCIFPRAPSWACAFGTSCTWVGINLLLIKRVGGELYFRDISNIISIITANVLMLVYGYQ